MFTERTSVGLDVHARSVVATAIDGGTGQPIQSRLTPPHGHVRSWLGDLPGPVAVAYQAGPTGFGLAWHLAAAGICCEVVAPSKVPQPQRRPGQDRRQGRCTPVPAAAIGRVHCGGGADN